LRFAIFRLLQFAVLHCTFNASVVCREPQGRDSPERLQFLRRDVVAFVFREPENEHGAPARFISARFIANEHAIAARASLPCTRHALFDDVSAEIGIHQTALRTPDRLSEAFIRNLVLPREAPEPFGFEEPHIFP